MEKGAERKKQLLGVALNEFIEKGFYGTSTREIARKAGVSSGLLFHYFDDKESIYLELIKIGISKMKIDTDEAIKMPKKYLFQTLSGILEQLENNTFFSKMFVFMDDVQHIVVNHMKIHDLLEPVDICKQWIPVIIEGQQRNEFRNGDPHALCVVLFGAVQGIAQEKVRNPQTPLPKVTWLMDIVSAIEE